LKSLDYNVVMTFRFNNNNNNLWRKLCKCVYNVVVKKVHVRYIIS